MKQLFLLFLLSASYLYASAQSFDRQRTVQLYAEVTSSPPSIMIGWATDDDPVEYNIFKKAPEEVVWGSAIATVPGEEVFYTDTDVVNGELYEYLVIRTGASQPGFGFLLAGIDVLEMPFEETLLMVIDTSIIALDHPLLTQYCDQLSSEAIRVIKAPVDRNDSVPQVKAMIREYYQSAASPNFSVLLFGHVPVPYSGNIAPDGHDNHVGAWAADPYYADMDGSWTDVSVDNEVASGTRNDNVPGDGKFDQGAFIDLEIPLGRVDFANLSVFKESEEALLERYLAKNLSFRKGAFVPLRRGIIENNFAGFEEAFGQNGLRNFSTMFHPDSVSYQDFDNVKSKSYTAVYGCGGGNFQGASGISNSTNMANDSLRAVFVMLFGSYFGDWDSPNNFLRSTLASGTVLANIWVGRPNFYLHHMAMGLPLGHSFLLSQNNPANIYVSQFGARGVHTALLGDPTLRLFSATNTTPKSIISESLAERTTVSWEPPDSAVAGFLVYLRRMGSPNFHLIDEAIYNDTSIDFICLEPGEVYEILVRGVRKEISASGSYYNPGPGLLDTFTYQGPGEPVASFEYLVSGDGDVVQFDDLSLYSSVYFWDFGDGNSSTEQNPVHAYASSDIYNVTFVVSGPCGIDTTEMIVDIVITDTYNPVDNPLYRLYPNPARSTITIEGPQSTGKVIIRNIYGQVVEHYSIESKLVIDVSDWTNGVFLVEISNPFGEILHQTKFQKLD